MMMAANEPSKEILLDDAIPGMVLADAVFDRSGTRLISPGAELTEKSIHALRVRGVARINVEAPMSDVAGSVVLAQRLERLEILFKNSLDSKPNQFLLDCLRRYRTRKMQ